MLASRRSLLLIYLLLVPLLSLFLIGTTSHAQPAISATPLIIVPIANVPQARGVTADGVGNVFAIGRSNGIVYKITPTGQISMVADLPYGDEGYVGPIVDRSTGNLFVSRNMHRRAIRN